VLCGPVRCCAQDYYDDPKHAGEIKGLEPAKYLAGSCPLGEGGGGACGGGSACVPGVVDVLVGGGCTLGGGGRRAAGQ